MVRLGDQYAIGPVLRRTGQKFTEIKIRTFALEPDDWSFESFALSGNIFSGAAV